MVEDCAARLPTIREQLWATVVGQCVDIGGGEVLPHIVVRIAIVLLEIIWVFRKLNIATSSPRSSGEGKNTAVRDLVQSMTPAVVEVERQRPRMTGGADDETTVVRNRAVANFISPAEGAVGQIRVYR